MSPVKCPVGEVADNFVSCVHWLWWPCSAGTGGAWLHCGCKLGRCGCWWRGWWWLVVTAASLPWRLVVTAASLPWRPVVTAASLPCLAFCVFCPVTMILQMSSTTKRMRTWHITRRSLHCSYHTVHNMFWSGHAMFMKWAQNVYKKDTLCLKHNR